MILFLPFFLSYSHADGSVKFWDASSTILQFLYKLKTSKPFERPKMRKSTESTASDDDPFAVQYLVMTIRLLGDPLN